MTPGRPKFVLLRWGGEASTRSLTRETLGPCRPLRELVWRIWSEKTSCFHLRKLLVLRGELYKVLRRATRRCPFPQVPRLNRVLAEALHHFSFFHHLPRLRQAPLWCLGRAGSILSGRKRGENRLVAFRRCFHYNHPSSASFKRLSKSLSNRLSSSERLGGRTSRRICWIFPFLRGVRGAQNTSQLDSDPCPERSKPTALVLWGGFELF